MGSMVRGHRVFALVNFCFQRILGAVTQGSLMHYERLTLLMGLWCGGAMAQDCNALKGDEKATCNAVQQNNPRFCEDAKDPDKRLLCMAKVQPNSYTCEKINSSGVRSECLLHVKKVQQAAIYTNQSSKKP